MKHQKFAFSAMASQCEICIDGIAGLHASEAANKAIAEVRRIERKYSRFLPDSTLAKINKRAFKSSVIVDDETLSLLEYSNKLFALSDGLFDITTGALQAAWDFKAGLIPSQEVLQRQLNSIGWKNVIVESGTIRFAKPDIRIDFGGIGKEYAADRASDVLFSCGVRHGYVNLGGDLRALGPKHDGESWMIGIRHPRQQGAVIASIPINTGSLATSGDYERYFECDGRRYCHIIKPTDGYPVTEWQSISVLAPQAVTAGATATIAMLKQQEALTFLCSTGLPYLSIDANGQLHSSPGKSITT